MQTEQLKITGMTCDGCLNKVTQALKGLSGVDDVNVSLAAGEATVRYDGSMTSSEQLKAAVTSAGYRVGAPDTARSRQSKKGTGHCG